MYNVGIFNNDYYIGIGTNGVYKYGWGEAKDH